MSTIQDTKRQLQGVKRSRQVCDHCGEPFGLVRQRWWGAKFCKRSCKDAHLREIMLARDTVYRWSGLLVRAISTSRPALEQKGSRVARA
jgi:hypothetical protein